ncbi:Putative Zinc finger, SWIM-type [Septoria linicola]|uniref:Zinc finger, SWIM-type n=1 Tax=Septoria linicola TaxID=215465 RepID=A0A9Q9EFP4_9PEZI|nr:putative Zinc finger, SWIM-type [Septoria linicola]USW49981.1 Putative Zinc finger, SWIM-type [Septoria linicola]
MASQDITPRQWATSLIKSIPPAGANAAQVANPLQDLPSDGRNILLTLYALFEKELLPALDLLDRNLVSRLRVTCSAGVAEQAEQVDGKPGFYLVRSAQQHNHRNPNYEHVNYYEVRLEAWSCSCPAFTFSAFPATDYETDAQHSEHMPQLIGGLTLGEDMPVCKHLLACVLIEHCSVFAHFVHEKVVSLEELAGWSAGWGD